MVWRSTRLFIMKKRAVLYPSSYFLDIFPSPVSSMVRNTHCILASRRCFFVYEPICRDLIAVALPIPISSLLNLPPTRRDALQFFPSQIFEDGPINVVEINCKFQREIRAQMLGIDPSLFL